jgi:F0F1-type ATP synthase delta subunit
MQNPSRRRVAKFVADQLADGESPTRVARILAAYLASTKQLWAHELILRDIETALLHDHKFLAADVTSARRLSRETLDELVKMLKVETDATQVELMENINSDLVGGVVVRTPEAELDATLLNKLRKLKAV